MIYDKLLASLIVLLYPYYAVIGLVVGACLGLADTSQEWLTDVRLLWRRPR